MALVTEGEGNDGGFPRVTLKWLFQQLRSWFKPTLAVGATVGSLLTIFYGVRIGYLPIDSLAGIASLGGVVALLTVVFILSMVMLLAIPMAANHWVAHTPALRGPLLKPFSEGEEVGRVNPYRLFGLTGSAYLCWLVLYTALPNFILVALGLLFLFCVPLAIGYVWGGSGQSNGDRGTRLFAFLLWGLSCTYMIVAIVGVFQVIDEIHVSETWGWVILAVAFLAVWIVYVGHLALLIGPNEKAANQWIATPTVLGVLGGLLLLLLLPQTKFHDHLMSRVSIRVPMANLVLANAACDGLKANGWPVQPLVQTSGTSGLSQNMVSVGCALNGVTIEMRVGDRWRVAWRPEGIDGSTKMQCVRPAQKATISSSDISLWTEVGKLRLDSDMPVACNDES